jgi:hypothetical protein
VRLRLWLLMSFVALAALCMTGYRIWYLSQTYLMKAQHYQQRESMYRASYENELLNIRVLTRDAELSRERAKKETRHSPPGSILGGTIEGHPHWIKVCEEAISQHSISAQADRTRLDYSVAMRRKYEYAARYPWVSVEPDPAEPRL